MKVIYKFILSLINMDNLAQLQDNFSFPASEKQFLAKWKELNLYALIQQQNVDGPNYDNVDGPPFTSAPVLHPGHAHIAVMKSLLVNFLNMKGYNVKNIIGYDVHGLPTESIVSKMLGLKDNKDIKNYGLANYNEKCEETVNSFANSWQPIYDRLGRFVDYKNEYKTLDCNFMETVWWVWNHLWNKDLVYKGFKIMPYSTECGTPLSNSEATGEDVYKDVVDPAIFVKFKLANSNDYFVVWTTTPWTLPANLALAMNPNMQYLKVTDLASGNNFIVAESCLNNLYKVDKKQKEKQYNVIDKFLGKDFADCKYEPIFNYYDREFKVIMAEFVTEGSGTGIVHLAPAYGQDDFDACVQNNIVTTESIGLYCPIDENGYVVEPVKEYIGMKVLATNNLIIDRLKQENKLVKKEMYKHSYPHCYRTDTPLIYKAVPGFFIKVTDLKQDLLNNNEKVHWVPEHIGQKRFKKWLEDAKDWAVSRTRFFGTPIPTWISDDGLEMQTIGSIDELVKLGSLSERPTNIHPQFIKDIKIPSKQGKGMLSWCEYVFDCWFESGCVPYGQIHYPFENSNAFDDKDYVAEFVCEAIDQCRGWFYTLMVISTALFNKPAFKNVICNGLILADDGKKFSKRLANYTNPIELCDKYGADAIRLYTLGSPAAHGEAFHFNIKHIEEINGKFYQLVNGLKFLIEHLTKFHKDGNVFDYNNYKDNDNITDNWILAKTSQLIKNINDTVNNYIFYKAKNEILDFIEDLTNWYIKFNRNRLRGRFCDIDEQHKALATLFTVLLTLSKTMAPFTPFLADLIYSKLSVVITNSRKSVHLELYPLHTDFPVNNQIINQMTKLQNIAGVIRNLRAKTTTATSAKMPIKNVTIVDNNNDIKILERYLCEEINAMSITYKQEHGTVSYKVEPNNKTIGQTFRGLAKDIKNKLESLTNLEIETVIENKKVVIEFGKDKIELDEQYYKITKQHDLQLKENEDGLVVDDVIVIVDFTQDELVLENYITRLFVVSVQKMRKTSKLRPWNKIRIYYKTDNGLILKTLAKNAEKIGTELLYPISPETSYDLDKVIKSETNTINNSDIVITLVDDEKN